MKRVYELRLDELRLDKLLGASVVEVSGARVSGISPALLVVFSARWKYLFSGVCLARFIIIIIIIIIMGRGRFIWLQ
jgi:hypothetical protein